MFYLNKKPRIILYLASAIVVILFFSSCFETPVQTIPVGVTRPASFYEILRRDDQNREDVLEESKKTYKDSEVCEDNKECEDMCEDIYRRRLNRKDCKELAVVQVKRMKDVFDVLKRKSTKDFPNINLKDLGVLLNISPEPIEKLFTEYGSTKARSTLYWIADDVDVADLFESEDEEFILLDSLLKEINSNPSSSLSRNLEDGERFHEVALAKDNQSALSWIHSYFEDELCKTHDSNEAQEACVLTQYCLVSQSAHRDFSEIVLDYEQLETFLDRLLEEPPQDNLWPYDDLQEVDSLREICGPFCKSNLDGEAC